MKTRLLAAVLLLSFISSCHKNTDIGPAGLLYKRWQINQVKSVGDDAWISYDTDGSYDTEYRTDGMLIYRKDGVVQPAQCCAPIRFERNGNVIQYTKSLPCSLVFCDFIGNSTIRILREDLLELESNKVIAQYRVVK